MRSGTSGICDAPVDTDLLGCNSYFEGLTSFIRTCRTPMTIAVQGDWETGKTSAMKNVSGRLKEQTSENKGIVCVWFNVWQYSCVVGSERNLFLPLALLLDKKLKEAYLNRIQTEHPQNPVEKYENLWDRYFEGKSRSIQIIAATAVRYLGRGFAERHGFLSLADPIINSAAEKIKQIR